MTTLLSAIGLILNFAGTYMMWKFTPKAYSTAIIGAENISKDIKNHKKVIYGIFVVSIGFLIQFVAVFFK